MKWESIDEVILSYVLLVNIWFLGKNLSQGVVVFYWSFLLLLKSVSWSCWCIRSTADLFQSICMTPKGEFLSLKMWKMKTVFMYLYQTALAFSRQPDNLYSFPVAGWWFGSLAKKKVWQRNPCPYGGRQPLGCRYAYVRVHRHAVLHAVFTSAGFLAKFQGHRYLLAVSYVAVGTSRRSVVCCFAVLLVLPKKCIFLCWYR